MSTRHFSFTPAGPLAFVVLWVGLGALGPGLAGQAPVPFSTPSRGPRPPAPAAPPDLPAEALTLRALTIEVTGRPPSPDHSGASAQRVTRTADRVHVQMSPTREWLYTRNSLDPRRASGVMIDHVQRVLVAYEESELRNALGIRGWLDVVTLGFDAATLAAMDATPESRVADAIAFTRFTARRSTDAVADVWWNQADLLPLEVRIRELNGASAVHLSVVSIRGSVDDAVLRSPSARFPAYREIGYADWLEGHAER